MRVLPAPESIPPVTAPFPVIIVGISRRSGTNFLARLLATHPDCLPSRDPVREDHLLRASWLLTWFVRLTARRWPRRWGDRERAAESLLAHIGGGLAAFLQDDIDGRVVSKTPSPRGSRRFWQLFPGRPLVVLLRDGRAVVESQVRGFGFTRERAMLDWRRGARRLLELFDADDAGPTIVVRYESLVEDPHATVRALVRDLGLDVDRLDADALDEVPVTGSSFLRNGGEIDWSPATPPAGFAPTARHTGWSRWQRERFAWVAGEEQQRLGYPAEATGGPLWKTANVTMDGLRPVVLLVDAARTAAQRYRERRRLRAGRAGPGTAGRQSASV